MCTYGDNIVYLPECTKQGNLYKPKKECKVEVSIDKKSKIYTITRINGDKQPIFMVDSTISLQGDGDASLTVESDKTSVTGDIEIDTSKDDNISTDKISVKNLYKEIEIIKSSLSDKNDS